MSYGKIATLAALALSAAAAWSAPAVRRNVLSGGSRSAPAAAGAETSASAGAVDESAEAAKKPDLNFNEAPVEMVLEVYSKLVDRTILRDPATPQANITIKSRPDQKLSKEDQIHAIEVALEMNGVHLENYGEKFVRALPREKALSEAIPLILDEELDPQDTAKVVSMMIPFKNIPIEEAKTVLEAFKSQRGLIVVLERVGKILVTDTQMNINRMRDVAREIDVATPINENVYVRQIKNANAADIKTAIEQIVTESQKELEKVSEAAKNGRTDDRSVRAGPPMMFQRRVGAKQTEEKPAAPSSIASIVASVTDADRGLIRGKVVIVPDERSNKLIFVTSKANMDFFDKVIESLDVETTPDTVVKVYRLKYAEAEDVSDMINDLIGNTQRSSSRENQNAASKTGTGGNLTRGGTQNNAQQRGQTAQTRNTPGAQGKESKAGELTKDNTQVLADKRINGLVVMTQKELVPTIENIIESMDIKLSQVLIETAIIEVTLGDDLKTGVDWVQRGRQHVWNKVQATDSYGRPLYWATDSSGTIGGAAAAGQTITVNGVEYSPDSTNLMPVYNTVKSLVRDGFANNGSYALGGGGGDNSTLLNTVMGATTNATSAFFGGANPIAGGINYLLKSDKLNIAAVIQATKEDSRAKYLAAPLIMTVDNKEATIDATENRQFVTGWTAQSGSYGNSGQPTPNYSAKDIGIKLKIKPKINPNGTVMLNVEEEYTQFVQDGQSMLIPQNGIYTKGSVDLAVERKMTADVLLEDRETVVLGGLTETSVSESESGIPILKDIPWIGKWLFGSVSKTEARKELLVFMTPYVLNDGEAAQAEALRRKNALSDSRPWDDHGWSASELADPVSKKELLRRLKDEAKKQDEERQNRLAVEKWKLDRAKELEKMSDAERKFWIEQHKDELDKEEKEKFEKNLKEQEDLRALAAELREKDMRKAEEAIRSAEDAEKKAGKEAVEGRADAPAAGEANAE